MERGELYSQPTMELAERCIAAHVGRDSALSQLARIAMALDLENVRGERADQAMRNEAASLGLIVLAMMSCACSIRPVSFIGWRKTLFERPPLHASPGELVSVVSRHLRGVDVKLASRDAVICLELAYVALADLYTRVLRLGDDLTREVEMLVDELESERAGGGAVKGRKVSVHLSITYEQRERTRVPTAVLVREALSEWLAAHPDGLK